MLGIYVASSISVIVAKLELGLTYLETCLNPTAQILTTVQADLERGDIPAADAKIADLISRLGTHNHYWYDMPQIDKLAEEIEANKRIQAISAGAEKPDS